jgi:glycosyltransferase involved in cell wall biosynthesis
MANILHIPNYYPPHLGGIEDTCHIIVTTLQDTNLYAQKVICFNDGRNIQYDVYNNVEVIRVGTWEKIANQSLSYAYRKYLLSLIKEFKPDIIHFHAPNPLVSIYLLLLIPKKIKLIVHWHSDIIKQKGLIYTLYNPFEKLLLKRADKIICTSPLYPKYSDPLQPFQQKIIVIQSLINLNKFVDIDKNINAVNMIQDCFNNKKLIFFIGRHVEYKGIEYLLQAEKDIEPEAIILIAGSGPLTEKLKAKYTSDRIIWLGRISDEELRNYLVAADIFAFPSITKNEAFGVALAEAMYCEATPVTFTIEGSGVNWVSIKDETGLEVENRNVEAYAAAINELLRNDDKRKLLGENARKRVLENFTIDCIKEKLQLLYENV